jgi:hypothetical protein
LYCTGRGRPRARYYSFSLKVENIKKSRIANLFYLVKNLYNYFKRAF